MWLPLDCLLAISAGTFLLAWYIIPHYRNIFIKANIYGIDMGKKQRSSDDDVIKVPEATGVITGCVFLMAVFLMLPLTFKQHLTTGGGDVPSEFPYIEFVQLLASLLSITAMLLLGFADDVLDLRWRHKLLLPSLASLPLLMVYYITTNRTEIVVPLFLRSYLGINVVDLGLMYYVYMGMLAIFCTNAINILAGINGLEVGQSLVIAVSIVLFNVKEIDGTLGNYHKFSLYFLVPYIAATLPLLWYNWYPAEVFSGDTFCYFSGMTLAVVAILGHFSKTLLLFFIPQVINFLYSTPQLFHMVPCPRHRLPKYDSETDKMYVSTSVFKERELKPLGRLTLFVFEVLGFVHVKVLNKDGADGDNYLECDNMTLINLAIRIFGPMHERKLTTSLLVFQMLCSLVAFVIRYPLALMFYGEIVA